MAKHIIFKGKERTGKSLFANIIFGDKKIAHIDGRAGLLNNTFLFDFISEEPWDFDNILIDDPRSDFNIEDLYPLIFAGRMVINRLNREPLTVITPRFIFLVDSERIFLPECCPTFQKRFHLIDFDTALISDLMKIIQEEEIIIKIHKP